MSVPYLIVKWDKERKLRLGMGAMIEFEKISGQKLSSLNPEMEILTLAQLIYAMMKSSDPKLTFNHAVEIIDDYTNGADDVMEYISKIMGFALGEPDPNEQAPTEAENI